MYTYSDHISDYTGEYKSVSSPVLLVLVYEQTTRLTAWIHPMWVPIYRTAQCVWKVKKIKKYI